MRYYTIFRIKTEEDEQFYIGINELRSVDILCPKCHKNAANEKHTCPYSEDINDDHESLCSCCDECRQDCLEEI